MENKLAIELEELMEIRHLIEKPIFQKYLATPMREYQSRLKASYDCKTLTELATLKGRKDGSEQFFKILKQIDTDYKNKRYELESQA